MNAYPPDCGVKTQTCVRHNQRNVGYAHCPVVLSKLVGTGAYNCLVRRAARKQLPCSDHLKKASCSRCRWRSQEALRVHVGKLFDEFDFYACQEPITSLPDKQFRCGVMSDFDEMRAWHETGDRHDIQKHDRN